MAYSTPALVRQALVPTSDGSLPSTPTGTAADLSNEQLLDAITEADAIIDGYLGAYYAVPVAPVGDPATVPTPLASWSRTIAAYLATLTYRGSMDFTDDDPVARRYKDVLGALKDVAAGRMRLQLPDNNGPYSSSEVGHAINPYVGDLWTPDDFDVNGTSWPGAGPWGGGRW